MKPQVKADINSVTKNKDKIEVRGYQNYDISKNDVEPLSTGHKWAVTSEKHNAIMKIIGEMGHVDSYCDIGCNLGLYVFGVRLMSNHVFSTGYDHESEYIDHCNNIKEEFGFKCDFEVKNFSDIDKQFDCVTALGLVHHLYHHTEEYGDLEPIIKKLSDITYEYLIVEFPTETDPKAKKWVNMDGRVHKSEYSEDMFIKIATNYFKSIEKLDRISPERPIFLLRKGNYNN